MSPSRLNVLVALRQQRLDACRQQLAAVRRFDAGLQSRSDELLQMARRVFEDQRQATEIGKLIVGRLTACRRTREEIREAKRSLLRKRDLVADVIALARANLETAHREVEMIDRLQLRRSERRIDREQALS